MTRIFLAWLLFVISNASLVWAAPSFDCGKAKRADEIAICGNTQLSENDVRIARDFKLAKLRFPEEARRYQRVNLAQRGDCGASLECILKTQNHLIDIYTSIGFDDGMKINNLLDNDLSNSVTEVNKQRPVTIKTEHVNSAGESDRPTFAIFFHGKDDEETAKVLADQIEWHRKDGKSDDDILAGVQVIFPEFDEGIKRFQSENSSNTSIVNHLIKYNRELYMRLSSDREKASQERKRQLCHAQANCTLYSEARNMCAIAGDYNKCLSIKIEGHSFILDSCNPDGSLRVGADEVPYALTCLWLN